MLHPEAPAFIRVLLGLHIAAGTLALVVVPIVMSVHKGGRIHRRLGLVYVYAMFVVGATAVVVGPFFKDYFLLLIAVFSSYLTFSGWRVLARKDPARQPAEVEPGRRHRQARFADPRLSEGTPGVRRAAGVVAEQRPGFVEPAALRRGRIPHAAADAVDFVRGAKLRRIGARA